MARPLKKLEDLKNPRRFRRSPVNGAVLDVPKPSKATIKKWQPLIEAAISACLSNEDRADNIGKRVQLRMTFPGDWKEPTGWPPCRVIERSSERIVLQVNAELILLWAYQYRLADRSPAMLYKARMRYLGNLTRIENSLLSEYDLLYNDSIEITKGETT